ncbi:MAG TPA: DUF1003 domain-containing protein [Kiritimatiellia bacterium]|nr:DUF1003 domain-containing protein [Kiritimatiellia bacterium]
MSHVRNSAIPLIAGLNADDIDRLKKSMVTRKVDGNETIFWAGDQGTDFFIIESGRVLLNLQDDAGRETRLATLGPGDCFGEISLLDGGPRTATCRADTAVTLHVLSRTAFFDFLKNHPSAALHLLETLGQRQRETLAQLRAVRNSNEAVKETVEVGPLWPRIADRIATISASKQFLVLHIFWFAIWIAYNLLLEEKAFDPYPFGFLTMTVSLEAIFLSIFVLVSANRQSERDRIRADVDHQVNLKAHNELLELQRKMDRLADKLSDDK